MTPSFIKNSENGLLITPSFRVNTSLGAFGECAGEFAGEFIGEFAGLAGAVKKHGKHDCKNGILMTFLGFCFNNFLFQNQP
jgi:hypothetical protein